MLMRAAIVSRFGGPEAIEIAEVPVPSPGVGQVRIRVAAAALNPVDLAMRSGVFGGGTVGLGFDVVGTVDAVGGGTDRSVGDRVFGLRTGHHRPLGTHAEYVVLGAGAIALAPGSLDDIHAATLPLNGLTADQALDLLALRPGQTLLVTGASGGVGAHAVELGHHRGLRVTALGSARSADLLRSRGANDFLPRGEQLPQATFDGVLDAVVLGPAARAAVRSDGAYVGLWPGQQPSSERGIRVEAVSVRADGTRLAGLARLADEGTLQARVERAYPLAESAAAHTRLAEGGLGGRIVLVP